MDEFYRIKRLPPYVFAIVNDLKSKARAKGEDIIDLGMGNPDMPTPKHIVAIASPFGSSSTPYRSWYQRVMATRSRVMPREAE